ncbi:MAG: substrate-binding domain-containing protein, partial [Candidatus Thermoplasmatota archaeon]
MINTKNIKKEKIISAFVISLVLFGVFVSGCVEERTTVTIKGSTTVLPVAEGCAEVFNKQNEDVKVIVAGGGSSLGIKSVANGEADIGDASREV